MPQEQNGIVLFPLVILIKPCEDTYTTEQAVNPALTTKSKTSLDVIIDITKCDEELLKV